MLVEPEPACFGSRPQTARSTRWSGPSPRRRPALVRLIPDRHEKDAFFGGFFVQGTGDRGAAIAVCRQTCGKIVTRADPMAGASACDDRPGRAGRPAWTNEKRLLVLRRRRRGAEKRAPGHEGVIRLDRADAQ